MIREFWILDFECWIVTGSPPAGLLRLIPRQAQSRDRERRVTCRACGGAVCLCMQFRLILPLTLLLVVRGAFAQIPVPTGANHPHLEWREIETEHFRLIHHTELDSIMPDAARWAEEAYRVVTTNLETPLPFKVKMYFSDNDEIRNAYAFSYDHIFIWMRGILDDLPFAIRSSGSSKWLRSVITHELTHTVIAYATRDFADNLLPIPGVPRWFNEGMARYMEPDGWTPDLDMVLRVSAITGDLNLGGPGNFQGTLLYEAGHALVRYIADQFGDSAIVKILKHPRGWSYNFDDAVKAATGKALSEIIREWEKRMYVYYNTAYGQKEETSEFARKISTGLELVSSARLSPDGSMIAMIGRRSWDSRAVLLLKKTDTSGKSETIEFPEGIQSRMSWSREGDLLFAKLRYGSNGRLLHDLYELKAASRLPFHDSNDPTLRKLALRSREWTRLTTDGEFSEGDYSPDGQHIVAVRNILSGSDLWLLDRKGTPLRNLTRYNDDNVSVYWPRWSPDGSKIAYSKFDQHGRRDIAVIRLRDEVRVNITNDTVHDRYPVWISNDSLAYVSYGEGVPNIVARPSGGASHAPLTDVGGAVIAWDRSPLNDSLLITSVDSRNEIGLFWMPVRRTPQLTAEVAMKPKYTTWRTESWPLVPRPADSVPLLTALASEGYNSLLEIRPLVTLPIIGTDKSPDGTHGTRWGIASIFSDPMTKHRLVAVADWGDASKRPGFAIAYQNNQLRPSLLFEASTLLSYNGVIDNVAYYQREERLGAGLIIAWPTPDALDQYYFLLAGGEMRSLIPWNAEQYGGTAPERRPIAADLLGLGGRVGFVSKDFLTSYSYVHSDRDLQSDLTYSRHRFGVSYRMPFSAERKSFIAVYGRALAQWGDELPQEFIGFTPYDVFGGGVNLLSSPLQDRLRGVRRYEYGNRSVIGTAELRTPDWIFQSMIVPLRAFNPQLTCFFDIGSVWYGTTPSNNPTVAVRELAKTEWTKTAGVELRSEFAPGAALSGGVAWELVKHAKPDWYLRTVLEW